MPRIRNHTTCRRRPRPSRRGPRQAGVAIVSRGLAVVGLLIVAACASPASGPTPYTPATNDSDYGYSGQEIAPDRVRLTFAGNKNTPRETVELGLLRRAAEVTVHRGYDHFIVVNSDTERFTSVRPASPRFSFSYGYGWGWHRRHSFGRFGWYHPWYGPWYSPWHDPFHDRVPTRTSRRYTATAIIALRHGPPPPDNPQAYDARAVLGSLAPPQAPPPPSP